MKIERRIGIGDLQNVRTQMLSVFIVSAGNTVEQLRGVCRAGSKLGMMVRSHLNWSRLTETERGEVLNYMFSQLCADHQLIQHESPTAESALVKAQTCEFIVYNGVSAPEITTEIMTQWIGTHGRVLNGNFGGLSVEQIEAKYPELFPPLDAAVQEFIA